MHRRVRLYARLRSAHLERARESAPATILFRERRYDFEPGLLATLDVREVGPLTMVWLLLANRVDWLEINEPLMLDAIRRTALGLAAVRLRGLVTGQRASVVTYAIGNSDPLAPTSDQQRGWRGRLRRGSAVLATRFVWSQVDRLAFGTSAAVGVYEQRFGPGPETALIPALPAPAIPTAGTRRSAHRALFVGDLSSRKGLPLLMAAWPLVRQALPDATLMVLGKGALADQAWALAAEASGVELVVDPARAVIHAELSRAVALVLPSQPHGTWREQVGLPIVEALSHGATVITTDQTGLADWLSEHGHVVLPAAVAPQALAESITKALVTTRSVASVHADLPMQDGRLTADKWLSLHKQRLSNPDSTRKTGIV